MFKCGVAISPLVDWKYAGNYVLDVWKKMSNVHTGKVLKK